MPDQNQSPFEQVSLSQGPDTYTPHRKPADTRASDLKFYLGSALAAGLVLFILFQQMQISQLQGDIKFLREEWKKDNETQTKTLVSRMDAAESKIELLDSKIAYLQTSLAAANMKVEEAKSQAEAVQQEAQQKPEEKKICMGPFCLQ